MVKGLCTCTMGDNECCSIHGKGRCICVLPDWNKECPVHGSQNVADTKNDLWEKMKRGGGSGHYRTGKVEPIDLYRSMSPEALHHWAILEICQHALRNLEPEAPGDTIKLESDMRKIKHYADMILANASD